MNRLSFSIMIHAPKDDIWRTLLADSTYRKWTSVFEEGSYAATDWKEGSKALFLTPSGNGMVSRIVAHRPKELLIIQHLGTVKNGMEDTAGADAKGWAGAIESYTLWEANGSHILTVEMDVKEEYRSFFQDRWPKALGKLKEIAEAEQWSEVEIVQQTA
jgi:hypothetical protein